MHMRFCAFLANCARPIQIVRRKRQKRGTKYSLESMPRADHLKVNFADVQKKARRLANFLAQREFCLATSAPTSIRTMQRVRCKDLLRALVEH